MELAGRVVVLTGAARGIGAAMARRFASEGAAAVVVSDLDVAGAQRVADEVVAAGGRAMAVAANAGSKDDLKALVRAARKAYGRLDIFCSNAGIAFGTGVHASGEQ